MAYMIRKVPMHDKTIVRLRCIGIAFAFIVFALRPKLACNDIPCHVPDTEMQNSHDTAFH